MDNKYTVYCLYSLAHEKIYIGYTFSLQTRLRSHNELGKKDWTWKYSPRHDTVKEAGLTQH